MTAQVIVLNGGSSSGKTGIARCLQAILPQPWLRLSIDDLVDALPPSGGGIEFGPSGEVTVGEASASSRPRGWPGSPPWLARARA
jgi:chloramphenicol 3-O phosphotransferase